MIIKLEKLKIILKAFLTCSMLLSSLILKAQNFERFSNKEGFNQNTINAISQDRYGFLWFGTPNGLIRYDGYEFKTYTTQSKTNGNLSSNFVSSLFKDEQGILWIGTNLGVTIYIPWLEKFHTVPFPSKFSISHIQTGPLGRIWVSGENQIYACELTDNQKGSFKVSKNMLVDSPKSVTINSFVFKDENTLILGTSKGLKNISLKGDEAPKSTNFEELKNTPITSVSLINNIFWIGTFEGLYKVTIDKNKLYIIQSFNSSENKPVPKKINSIVEDQIGTVWIGTKDDGLYKYNQELNTFEHYTFNKKNEKGLSSHQINALYQDDFNVLWIGTAQGGINKLDLSQKPFFNYSSNPYDTFSITDNLIFSAFDLAMCNLSFNIE